MSKWYLENNFQDQITLQLKIIEYDLLHIYTYTHSHTHTDTQSEYPTGPLRCNLCGTTWAEMDV